jgi:hypothetical protein
MIGCIAAPRQQPGGLRAAAWTTTKELMPNFAVVEAPALKAGE